MTRTPRTMLAAITALTAVATAVGCAAEPTTPPTQQERTVPRTTSAPAVSPDATPERDSVARAHAAMAAAGLSAPEGWQAASVRRELHDDRPVTVVRFEADSVPNQGGEHVTAVIDDDETLLGYTRMIASDSTRRAHPDHEQAEQQAMRWLSGFAAEYAAGLSVSWVAQHDETVTDATGTEHTISGVKVKTHHESGLYAWVIVDQAGQVITWERDIRWDGSAGRRATQMWLHDSWIAAHDGLGPQPEPPYAVAG